MKQFTTALLILGFIAPFETYATTTPFSGGPSGFGSRNIFCATFEARYADIPERIGDRELELGLRRIERAETVAFRKSERDKTRALNHAQTRSRQGNQPLKLDN